MRAGLLALLMLWGGWAHAQPVPQVSLLTFSPGDIYWQRFGHNALIVRDGLGAPRLYNYGTFDFQQKNFFLNFARGRMLYRLDVSPLGETLYFYARERRWALEQRLDLTPERAHKLAAFLAWNALPENAEYRYEYFTDNCSTRVRDALDDALDGALRRALEARAAGVSLRQEATRLISPHRLLMLGMDLGMGPGADRPLNRWQQSFVPMTLMEALRTVRIDDGGVVRPLVRSENLLLRDERAPPPSVAPDYTVPFVLSGLVLAVLLPVGLGASAPRSVRASSATLAAGLALLLGLGGLVLALGWAFTEHWVMQANRNLLLANPLWLLLVPACWRLSGNGRARRWHAALAGVLALSAVLALIAPWLPLAPQQQTQWLGLLAPINFALAFALRPRPAAALRF